MNIDKFDEAAQDFINARINHFGEEESAELQKAVQAYKRCADKLLYTLNAEQASLWNHIESANSLVDGETMNFYYRAGFSDALNFIFKMRGNRDND